MTDPKPLPSTPEDIDHAMATEVMGWKSFQLTWIRHLKVSVGVIYGPNIADYTPSTDLNQAFEAKFRVLKSLKRISIKISSNEFCAIVTAIDWADDYRVFQSDPCTTPEALATALCLALIAAKRGEGG